MGLPGKTIKKIREAIKLAFPNRSELVMMLRIELDIPESEVANDFNYNIVVFKLIEQLERQDRILDLINGALNEQPNNYELQELAKEINSQSLPKDIESENNFAGNKVKVDTSPPQLSATGSPERIIKVTNITNRVLDINTWREKLGTIEAQVCRIEIIRKDSCQYATGFLIAPNVAITCYHVIEDLINHKADYSDVILRFDYKMISNGKVINKGTEYRLKQDWLIDKSPYAENTLPTPDELDYALLRVDGEPGNLPVGEKDSPQRGWVNLPQKPYYQFLPGTPLLIVQHPEAKPLKLAFDTDAIVSINENSTLVCYKHNTQPGSSGSPCFDINWDLVALHHTGKNLKDEYAAGSPFSAICDRLKRQGLLDKLSIGEAL